MPRYFFLAKKFLLRIIILLWTLDLVSLQQSARLGESNHSTK